VSQHLGKSNMFIKTALELIDMKKAKRDRKYNYTLHKGKLQKET